MQAKKGSKLRQIMKNQDKQHTVTNHNVLATQRGKDKAINTLKPTDKWDTGGTEKCDDRKWK